MRRVIYLLSIALSCLLSGSAQSASLETVGFLPGGIDRTSAWAISADGTTVVGTSRSRIIGEAFTYDAIQGLQGLGSLPTTFPPAAYSQAADVSADGTTIVGEATDSLGRLQGFVAVLEPAEEVAIDIDPKDPLNQIDLDLDRKIVVAILGSDTLDAWEIDRTTLAFGPAGAMPANANGKGGFVVDVDRDGFLDLVSYYLTVETGIQSGDTQACVSGALDDGTFFEGCDPIQVD